MRPRRSVQMPKTSAQLRNTATRLSKRRYESSSVLQLRVNLTTKPSFSWPIAMALVCWAFKSTTRKRIIFTYKQQNRTMQRLHTGLRFATKLGRGLERSHHVPQHSIERLHHSEIPPLCIS